MWGEDTTVQALRRFGYSRILSIGVIVFGAIALLALSSASFRPLGLAVVAVGIVGVPSATVTAAAVEGVTTVRPFRVDVPDAALTDLRRRVAATQWPERETVTDATQGVQLATMQKLARYWATDYDWRKAEAKLNSYPQCITSIDGLDIHFSHVRSRQTNALPVIISNELQVWFVAEHVVDVPLAQAV